MDIVQSSVNESYNESRKKKTVGKNTPIGMLLNYRFGLVFSIPLQRKQN